MTTIESFVKRLEKIGIKLELVGNYPWVYLDKVNGKKVTDTFEAEHGFTCFFKAIKTGQFDRITNIREIFKQIRKQLAYERKFTNK